jgi:hypothetical protein
MQRIYFFLAVESALFLGLAIPVFRGIKPFFMPFYGFLITPYCIWSRTPWNKHFDRLVRFELFIAG